MRPRLRQLRGLIAELSEARRVDAVAEVVREMMQGGGEAEGGDSGEGGGGDEGESGSGEGGGDGGDARGGRGHNHRRTSRDNSATTTSTTRTRTRTGHARELNLDISPHRAVSAVRLMRIELGGAFADLLNEQGKGSGDNEMGYVERTLGFRTRDLEDRDLRLVTEIVGGTTRWKRYLDHLILSLCHDQNAIKSMEPLLLQILRIGFYEILKLEMPPYAVVDENVKLAKAALRVGAGNMVNALLRKLLMLKEKSLLPEPKVDGDDRQRARALATIHSHPVWMVRRWINQLGLDEAVKFMTWNNTDPGFSIRANTAKGFTRADLVGELEKLEVPYELSQHLDDFVRIRTGMQVIIQAGLLKKGFCSVQDESAGMVVRVVDPKPGDSIIDCCAAPGGKTLFMASCLNGQGSISAVDVNKGRLRILKETAKLHECDQVITTIHADLRALFHSFPSFISAYFLNALLGCNLLVLQRADLRWNRRLEDMEELINLQDALLDSASNLVKPGGVLIYSTCSVDPDENEERIAAFLLRHPEFCVDSVEKYVSPPFVTEGGFYSSGPVKHSLDGAFAARLIRST
ncbi:hypothetical protein SASPL_129782 [Salvia splendens]|uniref:SAM-dependent MTase RsmB/NOP-type domain-containing protein n=1 Tax=Salvia splendens TaxID=180675 RepID=A0A8X8XDZ0_SALSN|nr:hypothetical protein SASPL_129782 [Salvia splendens]